MDLFDSSFDLAHAFSSKNPDRVPREHSAPVPGVHRELVFSLAKKMASFRSTKPSEKETHLTHYDERIAQHLKQNGSWSDSAKALWVRQGFELQSALDRTKRLQKEGFLTKAYQPTQKWSQGIEQLKARTKDRLNRRVHFFHEVKRQKTLELSQSLTSSQRSILSTLGAFRQMTPAQTCRWGLTGAENRDLQAKGLVNIHNVLCDQKPMTLLSLTEKNGRGISGKDVARHALGLNKPATGIQKDHAKILHDVSVLDGVMDARERFSKRGFQHMETLSEQQMYQTKTSANSDQYQKYADAYLTFRSPDGGDVLVAVEFGNYRPSYLKEKLSGIEADHTLIYTHDEAKAVEYREAIQDLPGSFEVHVIPAPHMEVER